MSEQFSKKKVTWGKMYFISLKIAIKTYVTKWLLLSYSDLKPFCLFLTVLFSNCFVAFNKQLVFINWNDLCLELGVNISTISYRKSFVWDVYTAIFYIFGVIGEGKVDTVSLMESERLSFSGLCVYVLMWM